MAYVVATGLIAEAVPGAWRRLGVISNDGLLGGLDGRQLIGQLEELGIPRHHYGLVRAVRSWQDAGVPPDVAFALWLLRDSVASSGGLPRRRGGQVEDTGPTIRYLQLALMAGETADSDPAIPALVQWLMDRQLPDGGIPANLSVGHGEVGTTARALRVVYRLHDDKLRGPVDQMRSFLCATRIETPKGWAWPYERRETTAVTGATSLAMLALLEFGGDEALVLEGVQFLLSGQDSGGGWSEVPGHEPTIHNTFNVVRTLIAVRGAGLAGAGVDAALERAASWCRRTVRRRRPAKIIDIAHLVRLAVQLKLTQDKATEHVALRLWRQRARALSASADLYAETEISAIAMLECSRDLESPSCDAAPWWSWRWELPRLPPPFLFRATYLHESLYGVLRARWWIKVVDRLVDAKVVDRVAGLLLGTVAALGLADEFVVRALGTESEVRGVTAAVLLALIVGVWLMIKSCAYSSLLHAARSSLWSFAAAMVLTWIVFVPLPIFPTVICLVALRWLIIDVIAHTADASGLLDRMLPR